MYEINPLSEDTYTIIESRPEQALIPPSSQGLNISTASEVDEKPDLLGITKTLLQHKFPEKILVFEIDYNSRLTRIPEISHLENVQYLHLAGTKIKSFAGIESFNRIRSLFLVGLDASTESRLRTRRLERFRAIRGRFSDLAISAETILLQECRYLNGFLPCSVTNLTVESCHNLSLDSLCRIDGLKRLRLVGARGFSSVGFVRGCRNLETIEITGASLSAVDLDAISEGRDLRRAFLEVSNKRLRELSSSCSVLLSNGSKCYRRGAEMPTQNYYSDDES